MRILFISTHNLATNPRMVKEINLAIEAGQNVSVLCCSFDNWSKTINDTIKETLLPSIDYYEVAGNRKPLFMWLLSTLVVDVAQIAKHILPKKVSLLSYVSNKRSWLLLRALRKIKEKPDLVIAHNPGSFYPALVASKRYNVPMGIDLEDYHPGETTDKRKEQDLARLMQIILPEAKYITAASPLILTWTERRLGKLDISKEIILNYFSEKEFSFQENTTEGKLKLAWYSQNIAAGRGLEEIIPLISEDNDLELHLFGNMDSEFNRLWIKGSENIWVHEPLLQSDLHKELGKFDVGLALESPLSNFNRNLCLTNKILAYFQAGLYILATDTLAQKEFIDEHPEHGSISSLERSELRRNLQQLKCRKKEIRNERPMRFKNAADFSWEKESQKLQLLWQKF